MRPRARSTLDGKESRDHARHVGVESRHALAERERRHGGGHVVAESRQRGERRRIARKPSVVGGDDPPRRRVEVPGPGVVPEARPGREHAGFARPSKRGQVRKTGEERVVAGGDRGHGRLLEHDFRNPDPVRIPGPAPGEGALLAAEPVPECAANPNRPVAAANRRADRAAVVQEVVTSVRGAIQFGSRIRFRMNVFSSSLGRTSAACFA